VSAFKKLFLATALIGAGLGVACLLGEPAALKQVFQSVSQKGSAYQTSTLLSTPASGAGSVSSVRLLPESKQTDNVPAPTVAPPALLPGSQLASISAAPISAQFDSNTSADGATATVNSSALKAADDMPRARLRAEAPRPIGNEPRSPATIRRAPDIQSDRGNVVGDDAANTIPASWSSSPQLLPIGCETSGAASVAMNAACEVPTKLADQTIDRVLPWPAEDAENGPRTHVIVDGDSLQKLAGRYLNDPNRSSEIFELNRELLSNPELLPIGAELRIPNRTEQTSWNRQGLRNEPQGAASVREASRLVPLRPISQENYIAPRAHLIGPRAAE
jgi:nucleoid-associated protein YgaU